MHIQIFQKNLRYDKPYWRNLGFSKGIRWKVTFNVKTCLVPKFSSFWISPKFFLTGVTLFCELYLTRFYLYVIPWPKMAITHPYSQRSMCSYFSIWENTTNDNKQITFARLTKINIPRRLNLSMTSSPINVAQVLKMQLIGRKMNISYNFCKILTLHLQRKTKKIEIWIQIFAPRAKILNYDRNLLQIYLKMVNFVKNV